MTWSARLRKDESQAEGERNRDKRASNKTLNHNALGYKALLIPTPYLVSGFSWTGHDRPGYACLLHCSAASQRWKS